MSTQLSLLRRYESDASRYWLLVHSGITYEMDWDDGEQLLSLSSSILNHSAAPQDFTFTPRGCDAPEERVTIALRPDEPVDLLVEHGSETERGESHWFG